MTCCNKCDFWQEEGHCNDYSCECHGVENKETWEERFDEQFVPKSAWPPEDGDTVTIKVGRLKEYVSSEITAARAEERERCARVCDEQLDDGDIGYMNGIVDCAAAIRALTN